MKNPLLIFLIISIVATIGLNFMISMLSAPDRTEITYDEFLDMIEEGKVDEVVISSDQYTIYGEPTLDRDDIESTGTGLFMLGGMGTDAVDAQIDASRPIYYTGYINDQRLLDKLDEKDVT